MQIYARCFNNLSESKSKQHLRRPSALNANFIVNKLMEEEQEIAKQRNMKTSPGSQLA